MRMVNPITTGPCTPSTLFDMMYCNKYVCIISSIREQSYKVTHTRHLNKNNEWQCKLHRDKKDKDTIVSILLFRALYL